MNIVNLVGRLTKKPELRYTKSNKTCVRINIATDRHLSKEDKDAGKKSADFIPLVFWDKGAENLAKYCDKGSQISVEGRLIDGTYEKQDGTKGYILEVHVSRFEFLDSKKDTRPEPEYTGNEKEEVKQEENPYEQFSMELTDDELPF